MCPVIRISEDLYKRLECYAEGFDTPALVIEKLLNDKEGTQMTKNNVKKPSKKITKEIISKTYSYAEDIYNNKMSIVDAQNELVKEFEMDPGSARVYLSNFQKLMLGEVYQMTMNGEATEFYLNKIHKRFGKNNLKIALESVLLHITYYETFSKGKLQNIRKIYDKFYKLV